MLSASHSKFTYLFFFFFLLSRNYFMSGMYLKMQDKKRLPKKTRWYIPSVRHPQMLITYEYNLRSKWKWKWSSKSIWKAMAVIQISVCLDPFFLPLQSKYDTSFYRLCILAYTAHLVKSFNSSKGQCLLRINITGNLIFIHDSDCN